MDTHQYDRRASDTSSANSKVRLEIMEQLSEIDSPEYRVVLTLMLRMQDETNIYFSTLQAHMIQIHSEISKLQRTDDQIKALVLNGHTDTHHADHEYVKELRKSDLACSLVLNKHGDDGLCQHARELIEAKEVRKRRQWKLVDGLVEKGAWLLIMFAGGVLVAKLFPHLVP
jgi:hypothetical protein